MDQKQIEDIVRSVMASMGQPQTQPEAPVATTPACHAAACATDATVESCALDLGSAEAKAWIGVQHPHRAEVLTELETQHRGARLHRSRRSASAHPRVAALPGGSLALERYGAQRGAGGVGESAGAAGSAFGNQRQNRYLTRPDLGRRLSPEAIDALKAQCVMDPDVQVVVSDGLSTDAITANYEEILPPLLAGLKQAGLKVGTPFFVRYGRVKIEDQIGEILGAKVVILLVGERPGLGQSESLSCYAVYSPRVATTVEADRTCISNIHQGGTPPVEAAAVIVDLAKRMLEQKASGINMSR